MVTVLLRLKLSLLRNMLGQSTWRVFGLVISVFVGFVVAALGVIGLVAARSLSVDHAGAIVVLGGSLMIMSWMVASVFLFGTDETFDPARFALLPLTARQLLPGLLAGGALGVPGVATSLVAGATVVTWSRGLLPIIVALLSALFGTLLCLLSARALTAVLSGTLSSRRFHDLAGVLVFVLMVGYVIGINVFNTWVFDSGDRIGDQLLLASETMAWTPLGWAWSAPVDAAAGNLVTAVLKLVLSAGLIAVLTLVWHHFLAQRLTSVVSVGIHSRPRADGSRLERLLPSGQVGASAFRTLRYWRRDPRYIAAITPSLFVPLAMVGGIIANDGISSELIWAPTVAAAVMGLSITQDIAYDGSAYWTHLSSGIAGRVDLAGRALAFLVWSFPVLVVMLAAAVVVTGRWQVLPTSAGVTFGLLLCGVGAAGWASAQLQGSVPSPGSSLFANGSGGSIETFLATLMYLLLMLATSVPIVILLVATNWWPPAGWLLGVLGPAWGLLVARQGLRVGGTYLDRHGPEVLERLVRYSQ